MADNVPITPGSGATIATDEVVDGTLGTVQVQFLKLMDGTLNGTNKASVSAANALKIDGSAVTQPVSGTFWQATQPISGTISATQSGNWTARCVGNAGGTFDFASTQNVVAPGQAILIGGEFNTTPTTITTGNASPLQLDSAGNLLVNIKASITQAVTQSGNWTVRAVGSTGNALDFAGQNASGTINAQLMGGQYNSAPTTITSGNFSPLQLENNGHLKINIGSVSANIGVVGDTISGSTDTGAPVKIGGQARITNPTAVTDGQRVNAIFDKLGKQVVVGAVRDLKKVQKTSITVATEQIVVTAGGAGVFNDVYGIIATNKSATGVSIDFKDASAGTTRMTLYVPATDTRGFTVPVDSAMVQAVAANNWTATVSSAVSSIEVTMLYVNNT